MTGKRSFEITRTWTSLRPVGYERLSSGFRAAFGRLSGGFRAAISRMAFEVLLVVLLGAS